MQITPTKDGSNTLYTSQFEATYHSHNGAIQETKTVFIDAGLAYLLQKNEPKNPLRILDIGFGTGLNALMSFLYAQAQTNPPAIAYTGVEAYPIPLALAQSLDYTKQLGADAEASNFFLQMHQTAAQEVVSAPNIAFSFERLETRFEDLNAQNAYDLVYYDAFAPSTQPELWTLAMFEKMYACLSPGGCLVTYCAKGEVKRNLKIAGFQVEALPGPIGKREMTRAVKQ